MALDQITIDSTIKYFKDFITQPFVDSKFASQVRASDIEFSQNATKIAVPEVDDDGTMSDYGSTGSFSAGTDGGTIDINEYDVLFDFAVERKADAIQHMGLNAITSRSGVFAVLKTFLTKYFYKYFDMMCAASITSEAVTAGATPLYHDELTFDTLVDIQQQLVNNGIDENWPVHVYVKTSAYSKLIKEIVTNNGLANEHVLTKTVIDGDEGIAIKTKVLQFGNLLIYNVPDDRMVDKVIYDSVNKKLITDPTAKTLTALIIPDGTAFAGLKWFELRVFISAVELVDSYGNAITEDDLNELSGAIKDMVNSIDGFSIDSIRLEKAVYQDSSADVVQLRIDPGAHALESLADRIIPVYAEADKPSGTSTSTSTSTN